MNSLQGKSYAQITHTDLDGLGALILSHSLGLMVTPLFIDYSDLYTEAEEGGSSGGLTETIKERIRTVVDGCDEVLVTDISTSEEAFAFLLSLGKPVYVFDHHEISLALNGKENCFVDTMKSGTKLFAEWLVEKTGLAMEGAWAQFVDLVDVYDRFEDTSELWEQAQDLNRVFWGSLKYFIPQDDFGRYTTFAQIQLQKFSQPRFIFTPKEQEIISAEVGKEAEAYRIARLVMRTRTDSRGRAYGLWHGSRKISIVCYKLLQDFPQLDYIIAINTFNVDKATGKMKREVNGKLSVRARKTSDFDVTQLRGIHGHKAAGGGQFDVAFVSKLWMDSNCHLGYCE